MASSGSASTPDMVRQFVSFMRLHVRARNVHEAQRLYDNTMVKITEKFYKHSPWPKVEQFGPGAGTEGSEGAESDDVFGGDALFTLLYKQLYFRHLYVHTQNPSLDERIASWTNYCALFDALLDNDNPEIALELPFHWTWDVIDEFLYQYEAFSAYRAKLTYKNVGELRSLEKLTKGADAVWDTEKVKDYLRRLIEKSQILPLLEERKRQQAAERNGGQHQAEVTAAAGSFAAHPMYRMLGDFAIVGMVRLHVILGEFDLALEAANPLELNNKKALHGIVPACYVNLYYHLAVAFLMLHRYVDATRVLVHILLFVVRTRHVLQSLRGGTSYHLDIIAKKTDQCYSLLAICVALWPTRIEDAIHQNLRDKHGDKTSKLQRGEITLREMVEELWRYSGPRFVPAQPSWDYGVAAADLEKIGLAFAKEGDSEVIKNHAADASAAQRAALLKEVEEQQVFVTLRSYLKLYTTISVSKLAGFLKLSEDDLKQQLAEFSVKLSQPLWTPGESLTGATAADGSSDGANFKVENDMVIVSDSRSRPRYTDLFVRHINKFTELMGELEQGEEEPASGEAISA